VNCDIVSLYVHCLFSGTSAYIRYFKHCYNITERAMEDQYLGGQFIAMSLVHGGPAPHIMSPQLFDALVHGPENVSIEAGDIPDAVHQTALMEVSIRTIAL